MRSITIFGAVALALAALQPGQAPAQAADTAAIAAQQAAMKKFAWMHGKWRGTADMQRQSGAFSVVHTERVGSFLDGTLTVVEGKSYNADGSIGFNAFGIISYDAGAKAYWITSYAQGRQGKFKIEPTANGYAWEIPSGPGTTRYVATFVDGVWTETGDFVMAGQPARRFFKMVLTRIGDTDWPQAGAVTKD